MTDRPKVQLSLLSTGVPGLDDVLGGGLPEYSFNLLAGAPGSGKTTLVHQLVFANATAERPALYFTVLGEPSLKMLRYQQQMGFFDAAKVGSAIQFVDLSEQVLEGDLPKVLEIILEYVNRTSPALVIVDSFRTVMRAKVGAEAEGELQGFLQRLAVHLASWQTTSFVIGEYADSEMRDNPVFTIADGIFVLTQARERNSVARKLEVMKIRGRAPIPGLHTFRISSQGLRVFPRTPAFVPRQDVASAGRRTRTGVPGLDEMLRGGLPAGDVTLVAGPSGTGKTVLSTHFVAEGVAGGEGAVIAVFEEHPDDYVARAAEMGFDLEGMIRAGKLEIVNLRPIDLSADEILYQIRQAVASIGARRVVIDSLSGLEVALAPNFREDFRESLYRTVGSLTSGGVSVMLTIEMAESFDQIKFSPHTISFLAQNILFLRYVEISGELRKVLAIIKTRRSAHRTELYGYEITGAGMRMLQPLTDYENILSGMPRRRLGPLRESTPGLTEREERVLDRLVAAGEATERELTDATALEASEVGAALARLTQLNYAAEVVDGAARRYRSVVRPTGG